MSDLKFAFPFFPVQYTIEGIPFQPSEVDALLAGLTSSPSVTDLLVMSHGWNNNMDDAKWLYNGLTVQVAAQIGKLPAFKDRSFAVCGILWPSKNTLEFGLVLADQLMVHGDLAQDFGTLKLGLQDILLISLTGRIVCLCLLLHLL